MPDTSFAKQSVSDFLGHVAGASATPGGGSVAALTGALSASLIAMVGGLTLGKAGFDDTDGMIGRFTDQAKQISQELAQAIDTDSAAYDGILAAYKLPKATPDEKKARSAAIQAATKRAADVPLAVAGLCEQAANSALTMLERGNPNAASDAAVGALMALTGLEGAALNVAINLDSIKDEAYVADKRIELERLLTEAVALRGRCWALVSQKISTLPGGENSL